MNDIEGLTESPALPGPADDSIAGRIALSRSIVRGFLPGGAGSRGRSTCYVEEYEIEIGRWKATIVKQIDYGAGLTRYTTRLDADQGQTWRTKRRQRTFTTRGAWRQK